MGVWIDRGHAILVELESGEARVIPSKGSQSLDGSGPRSTIHRYISAVAGALAGAASIYILGPDETKRDLRRELICSGWGRKIRGMETADRMTEEQLRVKVMGTLEAK
jgi:hypothetical protein